MKKPISLFIIVILVFNIILLNFYNTTYAYGSSTNNQLTATTTDNFDSYIDSVTLEDINSYFQSRIKNLDIQIKNATSNEEKQNLKDELKSVKEFLSDIRKNVKEENLKIGKELIKKHTNPKLNDTIMQTNNTSLALATDSSSEYSDAEKANLMAAVSAIIIGGQSAGYTLASRLLYQSLIQNPYTTYYIYNSDPDINNTVKRSTYYQSKLQDIKNRYSASSNLVNYSEHFDLEFSGDSSSVIETDLYYAIHGLNPFGLAIVNTMRGQLTLNDFYDFAPSTNYSSSFSQAVNEVGYEAMQAGICHKYYIEIYTNESFYIPYPGFAVKYGSTGRYVSLVQSRLNQLGFNCGSIDGSFGPATRSAVISFQQSRGLSADGSVGPATWPVLFR